MLTERQMLILQAIIDNYMKAGQPISSKTLALFPEIKASSATIRNEMSRLEDMQLISKMHTSSGRVPVEAGYRYYINNILPKYGGLIDIGLSESEQAKVNSVFASPYLDLADVIVRSTEAMADLTQYVAITVGPQMKNHLLAGFRLVPVTDNKVMAIMVTDQGVVENQVFVLAEAIDEGALNKMVNIVNQELIGLSLPEVARRLQTDYLKYFDKSIQAMMGEGSIIDHLIGKMKEERLNIRGQQSLMHHFSQANEQDQINRLNDLLDKPELISAMLEQANSGIEIKLGKDLDASHLLNMSLMTTSIGTKEDDNKITLAILGPENMSYLRMAQVFQDIRRGLIKYIAEYYK